MSNFDKVKYNNEYNKQTYDRCIFNVPKGQKVVIENHLKALGYKSLNAYVNDLIKRDMENSERAEKPINIHNSNGVIVGNNGTINM